MPRRILQIRVNVPRNSGTNGNNNQEVRYTFGRSQLYRIAFLRFCLIYERLVNEAQRKLLEFLILSVALFSFVALIYIHIVFVVSPVLCLENYQNDWEQSKILRVEILRKNAPVNYSLYDSYYKEHAIKLREVGMEPCPRMQSLPSPEIIDNQNGSLKKPEYQQNVLDEIDLLNCKLNKTVEDKNIFDSLLEELLSLFNSPPPEEIHVMEYSLEYGFLRLSPAMRRNLNISVLFVALDSDKNTCFGGPFNKFLLSQFLGYENVLLSSVRYIAEESDFKGYVRSIGKEMEYVFVHNNSYLRCYIVAFIMMVIVTFSVTLLLRFSHQQMFVAMATLFDILSSRQRRDFNGSLLLTVILAVFGLQAVITAFFDDSALTLNILVIVWLSDFYNGICCHTYVSRKHWYRFFMLYQFVFYAYNYRFNGLHWQLNIWTSWLFTLHSMIFFFHHFELPYHSSYTTFRNGRVRRRLLPLLSASSINNNSQSNNNQNTLPVIGDAENESSASQGNLNPEVLENDTIAEQSPENHSEVISTHDIQLDIDNANPNESSNQPSVQDRYTNVMTQKSEVQSLEDTLHEDLTKISHQAEADIQDISDSEKTIPVNMMQCNSNTVCTDHQLRENCQLRKRTCLTEGLQRDDLDHLDLNSSDTSAQSQEMSKQKSTPAFEDDSDFQTDISANCSGTSLSLDDLPSNSQ